VVENASFYLLHTFPVQSLLIIISYYLLYVILEMVNFGAVLVGDNRSFGGASVGAQDNAILIDNAHNGGARADRFRWLITLGQ